jgi:tetratricopeptide (TPR) repeat protein
MGWGFTCGIKFTNGIEFRNDIDSTNEEENQVMRKYFVIAALVVGGMFVSAPRAGAQSAVLNLPRDSQHAMVMQRIGLTDITINYHRPLVKGRKVFGPGSPQPYGQVWRAGANENTTIDFSSDVMVEGKPLAKGVYGLHMIPGETDWTAIFSRNSTSWGSFTYDTAEDALRVTVKSHPADLEEALAYNFDDVTANSAVITLRWEKVAVPVHVSVDTNAVVQASLKNQLRARAQYEWVAWDEAATYLMDNKLSAEEAVKDEDRSIALEDRFENEMDKARALEMLNRNDDAKVTRAKAMSLGTQQQVHGHGRQLQQQKKYDEALEVFRANIKRDPNSWIGHNETARLAVAKGDYDTALKEMKLSQAGLPDALKPQVDAILKRLENKEDINK